MVLCGPGIQGAVETVARDDNNIRAQRTPGLGSPGFPFCPHSGPWWHAAKALARERKPGQRGHGVRGGAQWSHQIGSRAGFQSSILPAVG